MLGNVSLSLFSAMALMSLKLWEIASGGTDAGDSGGTDRGDGAVCRLRHSTSDGENYDAAVLAAGHCGLDGRDTNRDCQHAGGN